MSSIDVTAVSTSAKAHFQRGLRGVDLTDRLRRDYPGLTHEQFQKAAEIAWHQLVSDGQLEIRCDLRTEQEAKYSVWFVSGQYAEQKWLGDEHWEAHLHAHALQRSAGYKGCAIVDQVTGETLLAEKRRCHV